MLAAMDGILGHLQASKDAMRPLSSHELDAMSKSQCTFVLQQVGTLKTMTVEQAGISCSAVGSVGFLIKHQEELTAAIVLP